MANVGPSQGLIDYMQTPGRWLALRRHALFTMEIAQDKTGALWILTVAMDVTAVKTCGQGEATPPP